MKIRNTKNGYKVIELLKGRSNVFLLANGEKNILVDTSAKFMWPVLDSRLKKMNIKKIDLLILTHAHFDHASNAAKISQLYGAQVIIHQSEANNLNNGTNALTGGTSRIFNLITILQKLSIVKYLHYEPCASDYTVDSRFDLGQFGFNGYILHTPGHTAGSVSVIVDDEVALVGDCMFGILRNSAFPPFAIDPGELIMSWGKLLDTGCSIFMPSHGSARTRNLVQTDYNKRIKVR